MSNQIILKGNLGADPEMFYSDSGDPVATFSLAFKASKDKTGWVKVVAFKTQATVAAKYLHKGAKIIVFARLDYQEWQPAQGEPVQKRLQLIAHSFEFIKTDGRGFNNGLGLSS